MCHSAQAERLSGTYFFGGSGMDGPYIQHMITALKGAGIKKSYAARKEVWSQGSVISDGSNEIYTHVSKNSLKVAFKEGSVSKRLKIA